MNTALIDVMKETSGYDRGFNRYRVNFPVIIEVTEAPLSGLVYNLSLSGLGFVCSQSLNLADTVRIEITLAERLFLVETVIRWRQQVERPGKAMYRHGAQFVRTEETLAFIPLAARFLRSRTGGHRSRI